MDERSFVVRIPKRWMRVGLVALVTAIVVAPVTAFATHSFTDVPETNTFHNDIAWMAAAGVTKGCNPPANTEFCPKDNVTRETLAAFMRRLAENQVVDAGELDGKGSAAYTNPVVNVKVDDVFMEAGVTTTEIAELSMTTPADGGLMIWASISPEIQTTASFATFWVQVDNDTCTFDVPNFFSTIWGRLGTGSGAATSTLQAGSSLSAGIHTVTLCGFNFNGPSFEADASLTAMYATDVDSSGSLSTAATGQPGAAGTP